MRLLIGLFLLGLEFLATTPDVIAATGRGCRRTCGVQVEASCNGLRKRPFRRCRRNLIRRCRVLGEDVCQIATTTTATATTTTTTLVCRDQVNCGGFCCPQSTPVCAPNGDTFCCPSTFPVYCPDLGAGRYCCETTSACTTSTSERTCILP
jgi:hypothetical protein